MRQRIVGLIALALACAACAAAPTGALAPRLAAPAPTTPRLELQWRAEVVDFDFWGWRPTEHSRPLWIPEAGLVVVGTSTGRIVGVDALTGRARWSVKGGERVDGHPVLAGDLVLIGDDAGVLRALDLDGVERWRFQAKGELDGAVSVSEGRVFVQDNGDVLYALNLEDGAQLWSYQRDLPDYFTISGDAQPLAQDGLVVAGFADGYVVAFRARDGDVLWGRDLGGGERDFVDADTSPALYEGRLYVSSYAGGLYALDPADGKVLWRNSVRGASRPQFAQGVAYLTTANRYVLALDAASGQPRWQYRHEVDTPTEPVLVGDYLMYGASSSSVFVADRATGAVVLEFDANVGFSAPVVAQGDRAWFFSNRGYLYAMALRRP